MGNTKTHASLGLAQGKGHWQLHVDRLLSFYLPGSSAFDVGGVEDNRETWQVISTHMRCVVLATFYLSPHIYPRCQDT